MAIWSYSGWAAESTDAARLAMLRSHHAEVSGRVNSDVSADGKSVANAALIGYLKNLTDQLTALEERVQRATPGRMVSRARFR